MFTWDLGSALYQYEGANMKPIPYEIIERLELPVQGFFRRAKDRYLLTLVDHAMGYRLLGQEWSEKPPQVVPKGMVVIEFPKAKL